MITYNDKFLTRAQELALRWVTVASWAALLALSGAALAQAAPAEKDQPAPQQEARKRLDGRRHAGVVDPKPSPDGPQPRWVLPQQTVEVPPVWVGQNIVCPFNIHNEGDGDLRIRAKGG